MLNTIYITNANVSLNKEGDTIVLKMGTEKVGQLPVINIEGIVIFGTSYITPALLELCSQHNIHVSYISHSGRFLVRIQNPAHGNVRLRKSQYIFSDDAAFSLDVAKWFVLGKIYNCRCVLQRLLRDHGDSVDKGDVSQVVTALKILMNQMDKVTNDAQLRGLEGEAARVYYSVFNELIIDKSSMMVFKGRSRRPPMDNVNALLSFFYILLAHDCEAALETVGLDPQVGFYHKIRPGRSSLALDLMEELRPYMVDRFVVMLINTKQVNSSDFIMKESGGILIDDEARKKLVQKWQLRKQETLIHPFLKEKIEIGLIPYAQSLLLARYIRGDMDGYPPFLMR